MSKSIKKLITFSRDGWKKVESIQSRHGFLSEAEAVRHAVSFTDTKENPAYVEAARKTPVDKAVEQVDKAQAKLAAKEKKKEEQRLAKIENGRRIAGELRGEIFTDEKGEEKAKYYSYAWLNPKNASFTERVRYLDELTDADIEFQYYNDTTKPKQAMPADQVIATLVDLGLTDNLGKPV